MKLNQPMAGKHLAAVALLLAAAGELRGQFVPSRFGTAAEDAAAGAVPAIGAGGLWVAGTTAGILFPPSRGGRDAFLLRRKDGSTVAECSLQFGTGRADQVFGLATDGWNAYVVGQTMGVFSGQETSGNGDAFIAKYDEWCRHLWTRQFGTGGEDSARGVAVDGSGIYVVGEWNSGSNTPHSVGFVRKFDFSGTIVWHKLINSANNEEVAYAVAADAAGVYVVGTTRGILDGSNSGSHDAFVRKYDANGLVHWTRQFGSAADDSATGVAADVISYTAPNAEQRGVYVVGFTGGVLPGQISQGSSDAFIRKYAPDGTHVWTNQFGTNTMDHARAVAAVEDVGAACQSCGGVYVVGQTFGMLPGTVYNETQVPLGPWAFVRQYQRETGLDLWTEQIPATRFPIKSAGALAVAPDPIKGGVWGAGFAFDGGWQNPWNDAAVYRATPRK